MDTAAFVADTERRIRELLLTVDEFLGQVPLDRATWQRWKRGSNTPRVVTIRAVEAHLAALERQRAASSTAPVGSAA